MKVKDFIFWSPSKIKGLTPLRKLVNKFGVEVYYYLINNSNLKVLRENSFLSHFKDNGDEDFKWYINKYSINIVNNGYLLNKFLKKSNGDLLNGYCTSVNVIELDSEE